MIYLSAAVVVLILLLVFLLIRSTKSEAHALRDASAALHNTERRRRFYDAIRRPVSRGYDLLAELRARRKE